MLLVGRVATHEPDVFLPSFCPSFLPPFLSFLSFYLIIHIAARDSCFTVYFLHTCLKSSECNKYSNTHPNVYSVIKLGYVQKERSTVLRQHKTTEVTLGLQGTPFGKVMPDQCSEGWKRVMRMVHSRHWVTGVSMWLQGTVCLWFRDGGVEGRNALK